MSESVQVRRATWKPASGGAGVVKYALPALLALTVLIPLLAPPARGEQRGKRGRYQAAKQQLEQARRLRADLNAVPEKRRHLRDYLKVTRLYRRVYDLAPFNGIAADALAEAAETYHDMGKLFGRKYWVKSAETYEFLCREYPHSKHRDDALFNMAQTQHVHLKNLDAAEETYTTFLKKFPRSPYASDARSALRSLKNRQEPEEKNVASEASPEVSSGLVQVKDIRFWKEKDYTRVVVDLEEEVHFQSAQLKNPDRFFFDIFNTQLADALKNQAVEIADGRLKRIRVAENRVGVTRVVLEVDQAGDFSIFSLPSPFRLVVDVYDRGASAKNLKPATPPKPTGEGVLTLTRQLGTKVQRIVLDPGHGGEDTGTIGATGLTEKELVLDVARRLGQRLEDEFGIEVIYTRTDDRFVPLEERTQIANQKKADLFLSIHANGVRNRRVRGVETFYLNFTDDAEVMELVTRENAYSDKSLHELKDLLTKIARNEKIGESRELAQNIQAHLYKTLQSRSSRIQNRGVKKAPFVVLIGAEMPSILTELAFLSNPSDEKHLKTSEGRQRMADALFSGMTTYMKNLNGISLAQSGPASPGSQK